MSCKVKETVQGAKSLEKDANYTCISKEEL